MSLTKEGIYVFLEEVTKFITVTIKDLHLSAVQTKERDVLMDHTRSLQDMVNNGSCLSGWSDQVGSGDELDNDSNGHHGGDIGMVPALSLMPSYCGWLLKKRKAGGIKSNLAPQKRWCCLKHGVFYYYTNDLSEKQQGSFLLEGYNAEQMVVKKSNWWIRLSRPGYRTYEFQTSNEGDLQKWLDHLAKETQTQASSPSDLASRTLPPLPGQMLLLPGQMLPPLPPSNQHHIVPEPDMYDDTEIRPTGTDDENNDDDSYDDVDPAAGCPFVPPRPAPLSELRGPPQLPVRPGTEGRNQVNISKGPQRRGQPDIPKGPALPSRPKLGGPITPSVLPETDRPPTPPRRPGRKPVVSDDFYEPVIPPPLEAPEKDTDSDDSYDDAISEIVRPQRLNNLRTEAYDDSGFSSSDRSNASSFHSSASGGTDGPPFPPLKKQLPPRPTHGTSRPPQPIPQSPQFDLQSQLQKKLQNQNQGKPSQGKPKPSFYKKLYVAQFDYIPTSDHPDELELRRGDLIKIIDKQFDRQRWWTGSKEGKTGLVPKTYLTEVYKPEG